MITLLPSALARGSESRIYSHKVRMYVRGGSRSGMSRGMSLHTKEVGRLYAGVCVSRSLTHSDTLDSDIDHGRQHSLTMQWGHRGLDTTNTEHSSYSNSNTCHVHPNLHLAAYITHARVVCACTSARQRCACVFLVLSTGCGFHCDVNLPSEMYLQLQDMILSRAFTDGELWVRKLS